MNRKAQVVIIGLWVVIILTILAVGIGHRVSLALRLSRYQKDRLQTYCLAKGGVNKAIAEIWKDDRTYDSLKDEWAEDGSGITDEERKININAASRELLIALLEKYGAIDPQKLADNIRAWREEKQANFSNIEELMLVKDIDVDIYKQLKGILTAFGNGKININTAADPVLEILIQACVKKLEKEGSSERQPEDLLERIMQLRQAGAVFESMADLRAKLESQKGLTAGQQNILNKMEEEADTKSTCFYIQSNGKIDAQSAGTTISCVFDRGSEKIVYWHES